jgi:hypothetical protein
MGLLTQAAIDLAGIFSTDNFGQAVTYVPATGTQFSTVGIFSQIDMDRVIDRNAVGDYCEFRISQALLTVGGVTTPTIRMERQKGDQVVASSVTWDIIDKNYSQAGYWILILERNIRIVP